jgi:small conductance mechanosensitive channel
MLDEIKAADRYMDMIIEFGVKYGFQILAAVITLIIGLIVARWLSRLVVQVCVKRNLDVTLSRFLGNVVKLIIIGFVLIMALSKLGIAITPLIAALGAVAFGSSLALSGLLSNYGAGLTIIVTRPFVVGNTIEVKGISGVVEEIGLGATHLSNEDGEQITIPNKHIVGEILTNSFENKVVEMTIGISYNDDSRQATRIIREALTKIPEVIDSPAPQVGIQEFGDSSVNIGMRYWVPTKQYFQTLYQANLAVYTALNEAGITIPFPQRDIRMVPEVAGS